MKQSIRSAKKPIMARILIPGSKSMTNRALLMAALADGVSHISDILLSDDTRAFIEALRQLGIMIQVDEANHTCIVEGCYGKFPKRAASIECESAGTVARFLLAACAASPGDYYFNAKPQLIQRPIAPLINALTLQGATFSPPHVQHMPLTVRGIENLAGGEIEIEGTETGQFISGLLMIAPFARTPVDIQADSIVSRPYVDMTCAMMAEFGVLVRRLHQTRFVIPVPQRYHARDYKIEPDLSTASYFFASAAVTGGKVTIQAFERKYSKQGDVKFLLILEKMGCEVIETETEFSVQGPPVLRGINVDMRDFSDTFMTLAAIAPFAKTPTMITNIGHTRLQESNRVSAMRQGLEKLNVKVEEGPDWLRIYPSEPTASEVDSHHDHRLAMAFAVIGLRVPGIEIQHAECVSKTCPAFYSLWEKLV